MKPMCEANCGKRTKVYGSKYCPECHKKYAPAYESLNFCPSSEKPRYEGEYLLMNQCDGWHIAEARFHDDGTFDCFHIPGTNIYSDGDFYAAWAKLPDALEKLHPIFVDKQ